MVQHRRRIAALGYTYSVGHIPPITKINKLLPTIFILASFFLSRPVLQATTELDILLRCTHRLIFVAGSGCFIHIILREWIIETHFGKGNNLLISSLYNFLIYMGIKEMLLWSVLFWYELWILPKISPGFTFYFLWRSSLFVFNAQV
jgi:hypothetical protein